MEWQPIETAPRDDLTPILVYLPRNWEIPESITVAYRARTGFVRQDDEAACEPSHWMPLPDPPTP